MDRAWREAERAWERDPNPGTLLQLVRARRQAGAPLPYRLLQAQRYRPRACPDALWRVWYLPSGKAYPVEVRPSGYPQGIPEHWLWGFRFEGARGEGEGVDPRQLEALETHRPPGLELWESNTELLEALPPIGLRYLDLSSRTSWQPAGWDALASMRELQVLTLASTTTPPTAEALEQLGELPGLTSLTLDGEITYSLRLEGLERGLAALRRLTHLELSNVTTGNGRDLAGLEALSYLEELELKGPLQDTDLEGLGRLSELRTLSLYKCEGVTEACLSRLPRERLQAVSVRSCPGIQVKGGDPCPVCGTRLEAPPPEKPAGLSLPPTGGDYEWVETTSSWSLRCTGCPTTFSGTTRDRHYL